MRLRTGLTLLASLLPGCLAAWLLFAILFTTPTAQLLPWVLFPAALIALGAFGAVRFGGPERRNVLSLVAASPTLALALINTVLLAQEGRFEPDWLPVAAIAVAIALGAGYLPRHKR